MAIADYDQVSVYFILPETKGVSLERMEKIFGGVDYVDAGENEGNSEKREQMAIVKEEQQVATVHVEDTSEHQGVPEGTSV